MLIANHPSSLHFCTGCSGPIQSGSVVSFDKALFHLNCFSCTKCHQQMDSQSNVLLLTDGRPVCENCSYVCNQCGLGIDQEAIMTGQESYHPDCFRCIACKKSLDDLIYTQTSKGIYCSSCHSSSSEMKRPSRVDRPLPAIPSMMNDDVANSDAQVALNLELRRAPISSVAKSPKKAFSFSSSSSSLSSTSSTTSTSSEMQVGSVPEVGPLSETTLSPIAKRSKYPMSTTTSTVTPSPPSNESKNNSRRQQIKSIQLALSDISSLNLSFFDNDSSELSNLTQSLGANLHATTVPDTNNSIEKLNRASELLKSSLEPLPCSPKKDDTTTPLPDNVDALKQRLIQQTEQLATSEAHVTTLKVATQKALDEFTKAKENLTNEMETRRQHEYTILQLRLQLTSLQQHNDSTFTEKDIDRLTSAKLDLEKTCHQLKEYRNVLAAQIDDQAGLERSVLEHYPMALQEHIRSLQGERDALHLEIEDLNRTRDEVIHEMIVLNTKNAELSSMNNDLSRRMSEREREAAAVMAGTSFLHHTPSPSVSTELWLNNSSSIPGSPITMQRKGSDTSSLLMQRITSRDSNTSNSSSATATTTNNNKMFKIKKPKSNVFNKITSYNNNKKDTPYTLDEEHQSSLYSLNTTMSSLHMATNDPATNKGGVNETSGAHAFVSTSFLRPVKCAACGDKMWGATEYRCQGCSVICHAKCLVHLPGLCSATSNSSLELVSPTEDSGSGGVKSSVSLFGTSLASRVALEDRDVPILVEQCIAAVEARGMDHEGIYRKSGGAAQMRTIQLAFESNDTTLDLHNEHDINDICAVTSILKQYFRELPNPILTYELYDAFMDAVRMLRGEAKIDKFMQLITQLPKPNYDTLKLLMHHLDNVQSQSDKNLMTTKNLAMVFGPTLLRDKDATRDLLDMSYKNATIEFIINHTPLLFAN